VDTSALSQTLARLPIWVILGASLLAMSEEILLGPYKWSRVVSALGTPMSYREAVLARLGSQPIRLLMPLKSGEGACVLYLRRVRGMAVAPATSTVLFEKVVNLWATVFLLSLGLGLNEGGVLWVAAPVVAVLPFLRAPWRAVSVWLAPRGRFGGFAARLLDAFVVLPAKELALQLPMALAFTGLEVVNSWWILTVLGVAAPFSYVLLVVPLSYFANNIPVTVAGIGVREALFVVAFAGMALPAECLAAGVAVTTIEYIVPTLVGLLLLRRFLAATARGGAAV
jgi:hypothetical protein